MKTSILEKFGIEKLLVIIAIVAIVIVFGIVFYLFLGFSARNVELVQPLGRESWEIGQTYEIKWDAVGVERVGIVLFNGNEPNWIAENVPASKGVYEWKIPAGHEYGSNFWIAVFEYPWRSKNEISYSTGSFSITFPEAASCDFLSVQEEWPHLASDIPDVRKVFITKETFRGDLGGLEGANEKCELSAADQGYEGNWVAFIGGEAPENTAIKRLERTENGLNGIFIDAEPSSTLLRGANCHRLLGKNFNEFLAKLSDPKVVNEQRLSKTFLNGLESLWLGRIDDNSKRSCLFISSSGYLNVDSTEKYSYTVSCQDWTYEGKLVGGYDRFSGLDDSFPSCYTPTGEFVYATGSGGLSSSLEDEKEENSYYIVDAGKYCSTKQHLLCIEE